MLNKILLVITVVLTFAGCSGNQKLNESNIKNSINQYYKDNMFCIKLSPQVDYKLTNKKVYFGDKVIRIIKINENGKKINKKAIAQMKILKNNRFYTQHSDEKIYSNKNNKFLYLAKYTLTPQGEKFMSDSRGICIGNAKVKEIKWYTPEVNNRFLTLTRVYYSEYINLSNWAKDLFKNSDDNLLDYVYSGKNKEAVLFKTNKGWKDLRYLRGYRDF